MPKDGGDDDDSDAEGSAAEKDPFVAATARVLCAELPSLRAKANGVIRRINEESRKQNPI